MHKAKHMKAILITISMLALAAANVRAANPLIVVVPTDVVADEWGNGSFSGAFNGTNQGVLAGSYRVQIPGGGTQFSPALTYTLPFAVGVTGDLLIQNQSGQLSDVIRFPGINTNQFVFFSDKDVATGGTLELADTGLPYQLFPSSANGQFVFATESGAPDGGWVDYTPTSVQPGYVPGMAVTYHFVSEVPEPSAMTIAGASLLLPLALRMVRKNRKA